MSTQLAKGHIYSLSGANMAETGTWATMTAAYVAPNMQSLRVTHTAEVDRIRGQDGKYSSLIGDGEMLECEFTVIPEGSTIADAKISATVPEVLECFAVTGLPVIAMGEFADALNVGTAPNDSVWVYEGGASISGANTEKWTLTLPLKRYKAITSATKKTT